MAETKPEPGAGDVPILLGDQELVLRPTLECCMQISKLAGNSLVAAIQKCDRLDFEFICEIIALGLGETSPNLKKQIRESVFKAGVITVAADCILFVRTIMNGGVRPDEGEAGDDDADGPLGTPSPSENTTAD